MGSGALHSSLATWLGKCQGVCMGAQGEKGGGLFMDSCATSVHNCTFDGNAASLLGAPHKCSGLPWPCARGHATQRFLWTLLWQQQTCTHLSQPHVHFQSRTIYCAHLVCSSLGFVYLLSHVRHDSVTELHSPGQQQPCCSTDGNLMFVGFSENLPTADKTRRLAAGYRWWVVSLRNDRRCHHQRLQLCKEQGWAVRRRHL